MLFPTAATLPGLVARGVQTDAGFSDLDGPATLYIAFGLSDRDGRPLTCAQERAIVGVLTALAVNVRARGGAVYHVGTGEGPDERGQLERSAVFVAHVPVDTCADDDNEPEGAANWAARVHAEFLAPLLVQTRQRCYALGILS